MRPEPWGEALDELLAEATDDRRCSSCPRPSGVPFTQAARRRAGRSERHLVFACGRYEGIDQRVVDHAADPGAGARGVDRRLRAQRRRGRRARRHRGRRPAAAGLHGQRRLARRGVPRRGRAAGVPRLHQARHLARARRPGGAAVGRPRPGRAPGATTRPCGVRRSGGPTCCTPAAWSPSDAARRREAEWRPATRADAGEILTLQRACWIQEARRQRHVGHPGAPRVAGAGGRRPERVDDVRAARRPGGWSAASAAGSTATASGSSAG